MGAANPRTRKTRNRSDSRRAGVNPENQHPFWKPKFIQSFFVQVMSTILVFTGHLDQGGYVTLSTLIIGMFTAGSVIENKLLK
jgi:hypothetical protein